MNARVAIAGAGVAVMIVATTSRADTLADAIAKSDIAGLRTRLAEPDARCALGVVYARKRDLSRAMLYLAGCADRADLAAAIASDVTRTARDVERAVAASDLSKLEVTTKPTGMTAEIDALPGERFATDATLWLEAGSYDVRATSADGKVLVNHVEVKPHSQGLVLLDSGPTKKPAEPKTINVDLTAEPADRIDGPPPPQKHPPLIKGKLSGETVTSLDGTEHPVGDTSQYIDDPETKRTSRGPVTQRFVVRGGVAVSRRVGDNAAGVEFGVEHHLVAPWEAPRETHPFELISRVDWSERGFHVLGAAIGAGKIVAAPSFGTFGLGLGFHAQVRFDDELDHMAMNRFGIDAAASAELALKDSPIDLGVRVEQGLNHIIPGARERALIFEIGLEFRDF